MISIPKQLQSFRFIKTHRKVACEKAWVIDPVRFTRMPDGRYKDNLVERFYRASKDTTDYTGNMNSYDYEEIKEVIQQDYQKDSRNVTYGVLCGYNGLVVIDVDDKKIDKLLFVSVIVLTALGVSINIIQQQQQDNSKLPSKIEDDIYYQRWVTNLKNKDFEIEAEEFELIEEEQIYNTKWIQLYSVDDEQIMQIFNKTISEFQDTDKVVYSPSERSFIDYRNINKGVQEPQAKNYKPNEVRFFE